MKKNILYILGIAVLLAPLVMAYMQQRNGPPAAAVQPTPTSAPQIAEAADSAPEAPAGATHAVSLVEAWVTAGAPENGSFEYTALDDGIYTATFTADILPLFTTNNLWFEGSQACTGCHFAASDTSYHEMDLSTHQGILTGADSVSSPPGAPILGQSASGQSDFNWDNSVLRIRLRNNRMPPGWPFDLTETNRDGPCVSVSADGVSLQKDDSGKLSYGCDLNAVGVIAAWVEAGAPEKTSFSYGDGDLNFARDVQPFFTQPNMWFDGSQACSGCHFAASDTSYHEMDLATYQGILTGADSISSPPGAPILGQSAVGKTDYDWESSVLRTRLRNNRMAPGFPFDITEANREGPIVLHGQVFRTEAEAQVFGSGECEVNAVSLVEAWVTAGAPEDGAFPFTDKNGAACEGSFAADIQPLFTTANVWFAGAQACTGCHFAASDTSYHEMDLTSHQGILTGADSISSPPGAPILGQSASGKSDFNWDASVLRIRLRNNRMPPGWPFDLTETNRDGPCVSVSADGVSLQKDDSGKLSYGCDLNAVGVIAAWVEAGAPEKTSFSYGDGVLNFARDVLPFFTQPNMWFDGSQACSGCHFAASDTSYHEMDLSTYQGILTGADSISSPPGAPILGQSEIGRTDYDWDASVLRMRLRNNRMAPGFPFDITEANREGPIVLAGVRK